MVTYDRPVEATLHVHLANKEAFEAKDEDLRKFGYVKARDAYFEFDDHLRALLVSAGLIDGDITNAALNPLRYLVELAINHPHLLTHPELRETDSAIARIERVLQGAHKLHALAEKWNSEASTFEPDRPEAGQLQQCARELTDLCEAIQIPHEGFLD